MGSLTSGQSKNLTAGSYPGRPVRELPLRDAGRQPAGNGSSTRRHDRGAPKPNHEPVPEAVLDPDPPSDRLPIRFTNPIPKRTWRDAPFC